MRYVVPVNALPAGHPKRKVKTAETIHVCQSKQKIKTADVELVKYLHPVVSTAKEKASIDGEIMTILGPKTGSPAFPTSQKQEDDKVDSETNRVDLSSSRKNDTEESSAESKKEGGSARKIERKKYDGRESPQLAGGRNGIQPINSGINHVGLIKLRYAT